MSTAQRRWAAAIRAARRERLWSVKRLGQRLIDEARTVGVQVTSLESLVRSISRWESGQHNPDEMHRWLLVRVLEISERELFGDAILAHKFEPDPLAASTIVDRSQPRLALADVASLLVQAMAVQSHERTATLNDLDFRQYLKLLLTPGAPLLDTEQSGIPELDDEMKRRVFIRYLALLTGATAASPDTLTSVLARLGPIDDSFADTLHARVVECMEQWDRIPPNLLLPIISCHLAELRVAIERCRNAHLTRRLQAILSEAASFAGMLGWFLQDRGLAEIYLSLADAHAEEAGHNSVKATVLTIRADFHSGVQVGRNEGSSISLAMLEAAESSAGKLPSPERAWILLREAEEYAVIGEESLCYSKLDLAEAAFAPLDTMPRGMFQHWTPDMLAAFRGNCERMLGQYATSLDILGDAWKRIDPTSVSNRIALQADMGAVYAQQGEVDHAASLLTGALASAAQAGLMERVKRVVGIRYNLLANAEHPLIAQFDEQALDVQAMEPGKGP
jgi:hypothetical protein